MSGTKNNILTGNKNLKKNPWNFQIYFTKKLFFVIWSLIGVF